MLQKKGVSIINSAYLLFSFSLNIKTLIFPFKFSLFFTFLLIYDTLTYNYTWPECRIGDVEEYEMFFIKKLCIFLKTSHNTRVYFQISENRLAAGVETAKSTLINDVPHDKLPGSSAIRAFERFIFASL